MTLETIEVAVLVTTFCTPPMSLAIRDWISPVRVRVKNARESRWRWRYTCARRSCMTRWPTTLESQVWPTPSTPVATEMAIIPADQQRSSPSSSFGIASSRTSRSRNGEIIPRPAETTIRASTAASRPR